MTAGTINGEAGKNVTFNYTIAVEGFISLAITYDTKSILRAMGSGVLAEKNPLFDFGDKKMHTLRTNVYSFTFKLIKMKMEIHDTKVFGYTLQYGTKGKKEGTLTVNVQGKICFVYLWLK